MKISFLLLFPFLYGCTDRKNEAESAPPQSLPVIQISSGKETTYQEYPAAIEGAVNVEIRPQVSGILDRVFIDEGALVQKGQPLFKINERPFREQLNNAKASLHAAQAAVENARLEVEKLTPLVKNKVISDFQLKAANAAYRVAVSNAEQAKANVASAQINLDYTLIKAPVSGFIGRLEKKQGSIINPSDVAPLTKLSDVHVVHVYFSLGESDFITFKSQYEGNTLEEKLKNIPAVTLILSDQQPFENKGKIDMIDGQFDENTGAITLRASFKNEQGLLRSGNTGKIRLGLQHANVMTVPQAATIDMQDKVFVYSVGDSNKVNKQPITIVGRNGTDYLVSDGIKPGDFIVYKGMDHLQEGQIINPEKTEFKSLNRTASIK